MLVAIKFEESDNLIWRSRIHLAVANKEYFRTLCEGAHGMLTYPGCEIAPLQTLTPTCFVCLGLDQEEWEMINGDEIKLAGDEPTVDRKEYMKLFNETRELVKNLTSEQKQDRIRELDAAIRKLKIDRQATFSSLEEDLDAADETRRKELRKRDAAYRPRPQVVTAEKPAKKERAAPMSADEKAIATLTKMGMTREAAIEFLQNNKQG